MPEEATRPPDGRRGVSRRLDYRRPQREPVPAAGPWDDAWDDDEGDAGSAGVREPRHPKPLGPMADAGELPVPEPPLAVALPDPRR
jgi:hypothetical protein